MFNELSSIWCPMDPQVYDGMNYLAGVQRIHMFITFNELMSSWCPTDPHVYRV